MKNRYEVKIFSDLFKYISSQSTAQSLIAPIGVNNQTKYD